MNVEVVQRRLWERSRQHREHRESDMPLFPVDPYDGRARSVTTSTYGPTSKTCSIDYWRDRRITNPFVPTTGNSRTRNRFAAIAPPSVETAPTASSVVAFSADAKYSASAPPRRSTHAPSNSRTHPPQPSREMVLLGAHPHIADDNRCGGLQLLGIERCRRPWPGGPLARILRPLRVSALPSLCEGYDALLMLAH